MTNETLLATTALFEAPMAQETASAVTEAPAKPARKPRVAKAKKPAKRAKRKSGEEGDDDSDADQSRSVVPRKYREKYAKNEVKGTCSDEFVTKFSDACAEDTEDGTRISPKKLKAFAKANDVWKQSYATLNVGMQRMNIGNRLRAKIKAGHKVIWKPKADKVDKVEEAA